MPPRGGAEHGVGINLINKSGVNNGLSKMINDMINDMSGAKLQRKWPFMK